jgi:hypothetical protein
MKPEVFDILGSRIEEGDFCVCPFKEGTLSLFLVEKISFTKAIGEGEKGSNLSFIKPYIENWKWVSYPTYILSIWRESGSGLICGREDKPPSILLFENLLYHVNSPSIGSLIERRDLLKGEGYKTYLDSILELRKLKENLVNSFS